MLHLPLREKSLNNTLDMKPSESVGDLQGREIAIELYGSYFFGVLIIIEIVLTHAFFSTFGGVW